MNAVYSSLRSKNGRQKIKLIGNYAGDYEAEDVMQIPCNVCIGCRARRASEWSSRCCLELKSHREACFLSLTYNDANLPRVPNRETGETGLATLRKRHFQLFLKRLRKRYGKSIRFFGCGEYGGRTGRPHYHILVFGWKPVDMRPFPGRNWSVSSELSKLWPFGFVSVGDVNSKTVAYVSGYCSKKIVAESKRSYVGLGIEPEFRLMSRRPGIAKEWFLANGYPGEHSPVVLNGFAVKPPAYFDFLQDPLDYEIVFEEKKRRRAFARSRTERLADLGVDEVKLRISVLKDYLRNFKVTRPL